MKTIKPFLSPITLGTVQLGLPYGVANQTRQPDQEAAGRILDAAIEGGIVSFDTAPSYGSSETVLGRYFAGKPAPSIISKWSLYDEANKPALREQIYGSLKETADRLGLSCVPGMLLHTPLILNNHGAEVTELLRECVQDGLVGKVGVSLGAYVDKEFADIWQVVQEDIYEIVQIPLNALDQRLTRIGALEKLRQSGKMVLARSVYLQGLLFLDEDKLPEHLKEAAPWLKKLQQLAAQEEMTIAEFAFSYVRDTPGVTSVLVGAETDWQVRNNLALLNVKAMRESTRALVAAEFADIPELLINPSLWNLWNKGK